MGGRDVKAGPKLTKTQHEFLCALDSRPLTARRTYKPALALVERGYATSVGIRWSPICRLTITDAGRAAISKASQQDERHEG